MMVAPPWLQPITVQRAAVVPGRVVKEATRAAVVAQRVMEAVQTAGFRCLVREARLRESLIPHP